VTTAGRRFAAHSCETPRSWGLHPRLSHGVASRLKTHNIKTYALGHDEARIGKVAQCAYLPTSSRSIPSRCLFTRKRSTCRLFGDRPDEQYEINIDSSSSMSPPG
jgi:hypothetical protein